jgi:hypothetical protein
MAIRVNSLHAPFCLGLLSLSESEKKEKRQIQGRHGKPIRRSADRTPRKAPYIATVAANNVAKQGKK